MTTALDRHFHLKKNLLAHVFNPIPCMHQELIRLLTAAVEPTIALIISSVELYQD
jgi:hypothetical protein